MDASRAQHTHTHTITQIHSNDKEGSFVCACGDCVWIRIKRLLSGGTDSQDLCGTKGSWFGVGEVIIFLIEEAHEEYVCVFRRLDGKKAKCRHNTEQHSLSV